MVVVKKIGSKPTKKGKNTGIILKTNPVNTVPKKIGNFYKNPGKIVSRVGNNQVKGETIQFTLPSYGNKPPQQPFVFTNPLSPGDEYTLGSDGQVTQTKDEQDVLQQVGNFFKILSDPSTPKYALGYLIAGIIILIGLYGVVIGGQKNFIQSTIGQNVSGLTAKIKPKKKG